MDANIKMKDGEDVEIWKKRNNEKGIYYPTELSRQICIVKHNFGKYDTLLSYSVLNIKLK